ncbi:MAG: hypothetical protein RID53_31655 [Coleofasciculus sp. B1-GNL1-01]|uniref:hypothetical protein n=1 Tax=Coleofasciculus sp. B1-GNL1-01 TaxID=3068484 RepID=UPI0032F960A1
MSFQEPIRKKNSSPFNRTPAPNPLQRRRFKVPKPPEKVVRRSPEEQKAFLQQKLEQAAFVGYNGLNVPVKASETPPPQPIQQKPASGGSEDNSQPQEVPDVEATSEQVEETVESEKQQSSAAASQGQESSETEGVTPAGESEAETEKPQSQIPDLQAQKERASRLSSNWLKVPVNAPGKEPSSVQRKLPQKGLETQYQPLLGQRTNLRLNGLNRLTSETPVQTKRETPSDDTQEGISESETLEETETESDAVADTKSTSAAAENEPDRETARNQPESNSQAKRKVAIQDEKGKHKNADTDSANTDKSQAENSKSESTNPDVASAKTANQDAQKAVEAVTKTETAETTENLGEPETKTEAGAKEETATAQAGEQESPDATGDTPKQTPTDEEKVDQDAVAQVTTQKEQVAGKQAEAATAVAQTSSQIETAAANSQPPTNTGVAFTPPQIKPTFVTTEAGIAALNPQTVLGAAGNGMVVCQTENPQASLAAAEQGIVAHPIPEAQVASSMEQQRLQAEAAMSQFMASGSQRVASIGSLGQTIAPRIQASAGQAVAAVDMAISQNQATITNAMAQARSQVQSQAQGAKQEVTGQHQATVGAIKSSTTAARDRIQTEYQTSLAQLQQIETGMASDIAKPFTKAAQDFRAAGVTVGKEAIQIGNDYQKQFAGESPPEPSNFITEFLESFDRETYVENWRQAKIKAAGDVAASYSDGLQQNANEKAAELSTSQSEVVKGMQQVVATTRNELQLKYKAALQELAQSEKSALNMASQALKGQLQSIDQNLNATLSSLDQMQATQLTQLNSLGEQQKLGINANAEQVTAALQAGVNQATTNVQGAFQQFADQAQGMETPNLPVVNAVIAEAQGQLDGMMAATQASLETGISNSEQGIDQQTQEMLGSINTVTQQASAAGTTVAEEFNTTIAQEVQRASQAFTQLQNGHTNGVNSRADTTVGELKNLTAGVQQQLDGVINNLNTKLAESTTRKLQELGSPGLSKPGRKSDIADLSAFVTYLSGE